MSVSFQLRGTLHYVQRDGNLTWSSRPFNEAPCPRVLKTRVVTQLYARSNLKCPLPPILRLPIFSQNLYRPRRLAEHR